MYHYIVLGLCLCFVDAHTSLEFPEPRWPPYDGLKHLPCGVPSNFDGKMTYLAAGGKYNITWRQSYVHEGGYRINLLDKDGNLLQHLTGPDFKGMDNFYIESVQVEIPANNTCEQCVIQLERQGYGSAFVSCADVRIVPPLTDDIQQTCNERRGEKVGGACVCDRLYYGSACQHKDDCVDASDCNGHGSTCVTLQTESYPRNQCYCQPPYFGRFCERKYDHDALGYAVDLCFNSNYPSYPENGPSVSLLREGLFDPKCYTNKTMGDVTIYWRVLQDELEVILDYPGSSWIGFGWRPSSISGDCKNYPFNEQTLKEIDSPPHAKPKPIYNFGAVEIVNPNEFESKNETDWNRYEYNKGNESFLEPVLNSQPEPEPEGSRVTNKVLLSGPSHPMYCLDMVIASVARNKVHIGDYYSRDKSTPLLDTVYGQSDSITAAYGIETDSRTIVMFRKPLRAVERTDHSLDAISLDVSWAYGQDWPNAMRAVDRSRQHYARDEFKYHGWNNRGHGSVTFMPDNYFRSNEAQAPLASAIIIAVMIVVCCYCGIENSWIY